MITDEQRKLRTRGIGGSDAAKLMNLSPYGGPLMLYRLKTNPPPETDSDNEAIQFGNILENIIAREFAHRSGLKIRRDNSTRFDRQYLFLLANIDRKIVGMNRGLEVKTASAYKSDEWTNNKIPSEYFCQVQHYCNVMNWEGCYIACLIGGQKFISQYVPRDENFIAELVKAEIYFWQNNVEKRIPPEPNAYDQIEIEQANSDMLEPSYNDMLLAKQLADLRKQKKMIDLAIDDCENKIKVRIGDHAGLEGIATWNTTKSRMVTDWEAVAQALNASQELIAEHTKEKAGVRRFVFKLR